MLQDYCGIPAGMLQERCRNAAGILKEYCRNVTGMLLECSRNASCCRNAAEILQEYCRNAARTLREWCKNTAAILLHALRTYRKQNSRLYYENHALFIFICFGTFPLVRKTAIGGTFHRDALPKRKAPAKASPYCKPYFADNEGGGVGTPQASSISDIYLSIYNYWWTVWTWIYTNRSRPEP